MLPVFQNYIQSPLFSEGFFYDMLTKPASLFDKTLAFVAMASNLLY